MWLVMMMRVRMGVKKFRRKLVFHHNLILVRIVIIGDCIRQYYRIRRRKTRLWEVGRRLEVYNSNPHDGGQKRRVFPIG